ncbi:MAG: recombinase family protein, partial [Candidatus Paceibacterota bacterium]
METISIDAGKPIRMIAIYARVSTAKQEEDGTIETQLESVHEYTKKHGLTVVKEYRDDGWSGDVLVRPALDELRQDAKKGLWDAVLCYDPDRLARRYSYQALVMEELAAAEIEVIFVTVSSPKNS